MRDHLLVPLLLGLAASACGPSLSAEPQWAQWFSYRRIFDMAVSPGGQTVLVGRTTSDEATTGNTSGQSTWRPWLARVDADGTLLDDWTGYLGEIWDVALDADARAYVLVVEPGEPFAACELRALELDGEIRWSVPLDRSTFGCPNALVIAGDTLAVRHQSRLEAFDLEGGSRWEQPVEGPNVGPGRLAAVGDAIWVAGTTPGLDFGAEQAFAWRYDARDGGLTEVSLDLKPRRVLGTFAATSDGFIVTTHETGFSQGSRTFVASFTLDGRRRWEREIAGEPADAGDPTRWAPYMARPVAGGDAAWIVGGEHRIEDPNPLRPSERLRMVMQRWSSGGDHEGTLHHSFEDLGARSPTEADPAVRAHSECPSSDFERPAMFGSLALDAVVRPDGGLLVAGAHGCRDGFLLRMEVER